MASEAVKVVVSEVGSADVLTVAASTLAPETVSLQPDEVLVKNAFAGVNFIDTYFRSGLYSCPLPYTPGIEGAGLVVKGGAGAGATLIGKRVAYFSNETGSYATYTVVKAAAAVIVPDGVTDEQAAAAMCQGLTARVLTTGAYPVRPGDVVVVHAAAGGTGLLVCQMAKMHGATVIGVCGGEQKARLAVEVGCADHAVDYKATENWAAAVRALAPEGAHVVYDGVGKSTFKGSLSVLRPRGFMISFGNASGAVDPVAPLELMRAGSVYLQRPTLFDYTKTREELESHSNAVFDWILSEKIKIRIGAVHPLACADEAHKALEGQSTTGKILLECKE